MRLPVQTPSLIRNPRARPAPGDAGGIRPSQMEEGTEGTEGTEPDDGESGEEEAGEGGAESE